MFQDPASLQRHLDELCAFLQPFASLWQRSLLQDPRPIECPASWLEALRGLSEESLQAFDNELCPSDLPASLRSFSFELARLTQLPAWPAEALPPAAPRPGLSAKKAHETARITSFLLLQQPAHTWREIVDVGGGMGHLARALIAATHLPVVSIDKQAPLHETGRQHPDARPELAGKLRFHTAEIGVDDVQALFHAQALSLGLHTCGDLAWQHLHLSLNCPATLNFGCCYDRLHAASSVPYASALRTRSMPLSSAALFLATRGRKDKSNAQFQLQKRAQTYRFGLHLLLLSQGLAFTPMGHAPQELYAQSFAMYARDRLGRISHLLPSGSALADTAMEDFFAAPATQAQIRELWLLDLLRNRFARPIEIILLLDRALWVAAQGPRVALMEFFDRGLSPRNIGLYAARV